MRFKRAVSTVVATVLTVTTATSINAAYAAADDATTANGIAAAINRIDSRNGRLVLDAASTALNAEAVAQTSTVDVPLDPNKGVTFKSPSMTVKIGLPNTDKSKGGTKTPKGIITYSSPSESANAVVPTKDGAQFLTVVKSKSAPTEYAYPISLPRGGRVVVATGGTGAAILNENGQVVAGVKAPWAKDAQGRDIKTHFSTDGKTLTQHVAHRVKGVNYPIVADPIVIWLMGVTVYCFIAGSYEARNLRGQPWYVWAWGLFLACVPF